MKIVNDFNLYYQHRRDCLEDGALFLMIVPTILMIIGVVILAFSSPWLLASALVPAGYLRVWKALLSGNVYKHLSSSQIDLWRTQKSLPKALAEETTKLSFDEIKTLDRPEADRLVNSMERATAAYENAQRQANMPNIRDRIRQFDAMADGYREGTNKMKELSAHDD